MWERQLKVNQFMLELGLQQKIQELLEPIVDNLRTVNAKLDRGLDADFKKIKHRLSDIEQVCFGTKGKDLRFESIEKKLEDLCIKQASEHKTIESEFESLLVKSTN